MQDREELEGETVPVSGLLIDSPGANTLRKNADLFAKRGRAGTLSRTAAAMALYTLQTFAPVRRRRTPDLAARRRPLVHAVAAGAAA